ncbi:hypothetical protein [Neorhizobium sp. NCHU2750]|uniref:hypothetical protein n=1 Tax=Neorhizobium sp. NCHU2750 TaxID=1825976 RepID=UPI000E74D10A|nr:hypothetical protein NCHU2750_45120 [Neorhizobium sp. NCHU2750]
MMEGSGLIGQFLRQQSNPPPALGRTARPIGDVSTTAAVTLTAIRRADGGGELIMGREVEARLRFAVHRYVAPLQGSFHRMEITLDPASMAGLDARAGVDRPLMLITAEMPLENEQVFTVPFQRAGVARIEAEPDGNGDFARFNPTVGAVSLGGDEGRHLLASCMAAVDPYREESSGACASFPLPLVEMSFWPDTQTPPKPLWQLHRQSRPASRQRFAVAAANHDELIGWHREISDALRPDCERWLEHGRPTGDAYLTEAIAARQADIAAWQALAGSDDARGLGAGATVSALARLYLSQAIAAWARFRAFDEMIGFGVSPEDSRSRRELLLLLDGIANADGQQAMLTAIRDALANGQTLFSPPRAEELLRKVSRRLNDL